MNIKESTSRVLFKYYKENRDVNKVIQVSRAMLESKNSSALIRGELCEALLVIMLTDFIKKHNLDDWFIAKGLILKDMDNPDSKYLTELDVTLFTPKKIYLFECKSYKGEKKIGKNCTLYTRNGNGQWRENLDVYSQHTKHYKALYKYLNPFRINVHTKYKPYKIIFFDFSIGEILDVREEKMKKLFPIKNEKDLYSIFSTYNQEPIQWDIKYVRKAVSMLNASKEKLTGVHLDYVTSLHGSRNHK